MLLALATFVNATRTSETYHRYHERPAPTADAFNPALPPDATITIPPAMSSLSTLPPNAIADAYDTAMHSLESRFQHEMALVHANASAQIQSLQVNLRTWTMEMSASYRNDVMESVHTWAYYCNKWKAQNEGLAKRAAPTGREI